MRHGVGTCSSGAFDQYMGEWHTNRKSGLGVQTSKPGLGDSVDTYMGEWKQSCRHGLGHVKDAEGVGGVGTGVAARQERRTRSQRSARPGSPGSRGANLSVRFGTAWAVGGATAGRPLRPVEESDSPL